MATSIVVTTSMTGLQTYTLIVPNTDSYIVKVTNTLPTSITTGNVGSGAGSQPTQMSTAALASSLVTTINQNGSPVYTSVAGSRSAYAILNCTAGDTITIVTTSSNPVVDNAVNAVRSTISISEGNV